MYIRVIKDNNEVTWGWKKQLIPKSTLIDSIVDLSKCRIYAETSFNRTQTTPNINIINIMLQLLKFPDDLTEWSGFNESYYYDFRKSSDCLGTASQNNVYKKLWFELYLC